MNYQDIIIAIVNICFIYALVPQVYYGFKMKKPFVTFQTSVITFLGLVVLTFVFLSLDLILSTVAALFSSICWYLLLVQRVVYG